MTLALVATDGAVFQDASEAVLNADQTQPGVELIHFSFHENPAFIGLIQNGDGGVLVKGHAGQEVMIFIGIPLILGQLDFNITNGKGVRNCVSSVVEVCQSSAGDCGCNQSDNQAQRDNLLFS